jgi:hypothetical protein
MNFYHFTAREYLPAIAREGLTRGEVPITMNIVRRGVWFTTDDRPDGHGLTDGRPLTVAEKRLIGRPDDAPDRFPDKRAVRFKVLVSEAGGPALVRWSEWGARDLAPDWYRRPRKAGGGKANTWYVYFGAIPPENVAEPFDLRADEPLKGWPAAYLARPVVRGVEAGCTVGRR